MKPKKVKIYNLIIADQSGSMDHLLEPMLSGLNKVMSGIRSSQLKYYETQEHFVSVLAFCSYECRYIFENAPISDVRKITNDDYHPCGCTSLLDAVGMALTQLDCKSVGDIQSNQLVSIITDGLDNTSHEYNTKCVRSIVERLSRDGWSFAYIGTGHDVKSVAKCLSINNYLSFVNNNEGAINMFKQANKAYKQTFKDINSCICGKPYMTDDEVLESKKCMARNFMNI